MLQKMGWKEGKGLGANLDGQVEHVKVSLKTDSAGIVINHNNNFTNTLTGLGVTKRDIVEDTYGHTRGFDDLLKSLASSKEKKSSKETKKKKSKKESKKTGSLEKKKKDSDSKTVKRIHRRKFMQSKNMASYSDSQMKEIFGVQL